MSEDEPIDEESVGQGLDGAAVISAIARLRGTKEGPTFVRIAEWSRRSPYTVLRVLDAVIALDESRAPRSEVGA